MTDSGPNTFVQGANSFFGNTATKNLGAVADGVSDAIHGNRGPRRPQGGTTST